MASSRNGSMIALREQPQVGGFGVVELRRVGVFGCQPESFTTSDRIPGALAMWSAALRSECIEAVAGRTEATKRVYTDGALAVIDDVAARVAPDDPQSAHARAFSICTLMVGTSQLYRAPADGRLADVVLEQGIRCALALREVEGPRRGRQVDDRGAGATDDEQ